LEIPALNRIEDERDPKSKLHDCLRQACGLSGRRLKKFRVRRAAVRVADYISDFSLLRQVPSFARLEADMCITLRQIGQAYGTASD
jgi:hypothetical protein